MADLKTFCKSLSALLKSGLSLHQSLVLLSAEGFQDSALIQHHLENGHSFSEGLQLLNSDNIPLLSVTHIPDIRLYLEQLANYLDTKSKQKKYFLNQLRYPMILGLCMLGLLALFWFWMIPIYTQFYTNLGLTVPSILSTVNTCNRILSEYKWVGISGCLSAMAAIRFFWMDKLKRLYQHIWNPFSEADILWILALSVRSGLSLKDSLQTLQLQPPHPFYEKYQLFLGECTQTGEFSKPFSFFFNCSILYREWMITSEKSGQLVHAMMDISEQLFEEEKKKFERVIAIVQPVLLGIVTLMVGGSLYLTFLPTLHSLTLLQ